MSVKLVLAVSCSALLAASYCYQYSCLHIRGIHAIRFYWCTTAVEVVVLVVVVVVVVVVAVLVGGGL